MTTENTRWDDDSFDCDWFIVELFEHQVNSCFCHRAGVLLDAANPMNIVWAFAGFGLALVASFIATFILYKDE